MIATARTSIAQLRVSRLAAMLPVHRAFHWLHLHELQLRQWQLQFLAIPAPPFGEAARAVWFLERFEELGLRNPHIDQEGNALAELPGRTPADAPPAAPRYVLLSAHLDTVFGAGTDTSPREEGTRILGPGSCDNGAGLAALLGIAAALRSAEITPPMPILFAANVGEEGEGDLRGMRHLFQAGSYAGKIQAAIALEGSGTAAAVTRALGSRRFRVTISGPGGHSWTDADTPNPITLISRAITELAGEHPVKAAGDARTTFSPGQISGGTSINSIPESASVDLDLRSTEPEELEARAAWIQQVFTAVVAQAPPASLVVQAIGERPAAALPESSPLLDTVRAVDRHLGLRTELRLGSTDANLPLSLGIPAAALAAGGTGGGIHTLGEWYDPAGRETALRRIVLTLLDLAQTIDSNTDQEDGVA
jgi:acetylornithine deacetylase/succinyl-diaminopimelate desuccinylase-like protein